MTGSIAGIPIAVDLLAGITGSASGGMSIALQALGSTCLEKGRRVADLVPIVIGLPPTALPAWIPINRLAGKARAGPP